MDQNKSARPKDIASATADNIPKEFQEAFSRVVKAGMKVMFSDETHELMLDQLEGEGDLAEKVGMAVAGMMAMLFEKSNGTMPSEVIIPAATYLLAQGADFLEQVTGEELTPDIIADASEVMIRQLMQAAGADPDKFTAGLQSAADKIGSQQTAEEPEDPEMAEEPEDPEEEEMRSA
jgi:hypothetical protein